MQCYGCGKNIPFSSTVCSNCQCDTSKARTNEMLAFAFGILSSAIGYFISGVWGAVGGFVLGGGAANAILRQHGKNKPPGFQVGQPTQPPAGDTTASELTEFKQLHDQGLLPDEESSTRDKNREMKMLEMRCVSCGGKLRITHEMNQFTCGYCGTEQIAQRSGGTVALKLVADAIEKVQVGTDRTAAELALVRLKAELAEAIEKIANPLPFLPKDFDARSSNEGIERKKSDGEIVAWSIAVVAGLFLLFIIASSLKWPDEFNWGKGILWAVGLQIVIILSIQKATALAKEQSISTNPVVKEHVATLILQRENILKQIDENKSRVQ